MKALVKEAAAPGEVAYRDWPEPEIDSADVLIAVKRAGVCGTDLSMYEWSPTIATSYRPELPLIMGHEFTGEVAKTGEAVTGLRPGDQVIVNPALTCGACRFCLAGRSMLCPSRKVMGLQAQGAFAEYAVVPARNVQRLPSRLPWELAAVGEPFAVAVHALERVPVEQGDVVAIVGPGNIGFCMLAALKLILAARIVMVGLQADRQQLAMAEDMGATVVRSDREDAEAVLRELSDGLGADATFETAGHPRAVEQAIRIARKGGRIGLIGLPHDVAHIDTASVALSEQEVIGIRAYDVATWRRVPTLLERAADDLSRIVTHSLPLDQFAQAAELTRSREGLKVLLTVNH